MTTLNFRRHRRLRSSEGMRSLVRETLLGKHDLIYPIFVVESGQERKPIRSLPGIYQIPLRILEKEIVQLGIQAVLVFGIPDEKDELGSRAYHDQGIVQDSIRKIKDAFPNLIVIADTCLCEYASHGHCGIVQGERILNDPSLDLLARTAVSQAVAGADIIAPSNMMDGTVAAIRAGLDKAGFQDIPIMSYAVKYASAFYGPFRDAAASTPTFGDRKTYQMDVGNRFEALREAESDIREGADFLIVKPALAYLDIVRDVRNKHHVPIVTYNVGGEYAMIKAAAQNGWIDERTTVMESLLGMKRAGADLIITYHARDVLKWLSQSQS